MCPTSDFIWFLLNCVLLSTNFFAQKISFGFVTRMRISDKNEKMIIANWLHMQLCHVRADVRICSRKLLRVSGLYFI